MNWSIIYTDGRMPAHAATRAQARTIAKETNGKVVQGHVLPEVKLELDPPVTVTPAFEGIVFKVPPKDDTPPVVEVAPVKVKEPKPEIRRESTMKGAVLRVFQVCDAVLAANPAARRRDLMAACLAEGIAYYTARTRIQQYIQAHRNDVERASSKE